jgi:predicted nucleic acid-binding protein
MMTAPDSFVDTNVFVYAQDVSDAKKRKKALELLKQLSEEGRLAISTQVLQEFASVATRKLGLSLPETTALVEELAKLPTLSIDAAVIKYALSIHFAHQFSFFDSLIIATAAQHKCTRVFTEDMAHGQFVCGLELINPFI